MSFGIPAIKVIPVYGRTAGVSTGKPLARCMR
jgi:hypothetical protein